MEIELRTRSLIAEVTIYSGNTKIEEDLAELKNGIGYIPDTEIVKFLNIAREMNLYNGKSDVDFIKMIYDDFLSRSEKESFLKTILCD